MLTTLLTALCILDSLSAPLLDTNIINDFDYEFRIKNVSRLFAGNSNVNYSRK